MLVEEYFANEYSEEWLEWFNLSPLERWHESMAMWKTFTFLGGKLEPEPDPDSPFYNAEASGEVSPNGGPGVRIIRRGGV